MRRQHTFLAAAAALALGAAAPAPAKAQAAPGASPTSPAAATPPMRNHFDTDSLMREPGFFDMVVLGQPAKARWLVLTDPNPPSAPNRLVQTETRLPEGTIAAAVRRNVTFQDGAVSTFVKRGDGHAGLVLRMTGEKRFLLLLANTASGEVVLSSWRDGKSVELGRGSSPFDHSWQKLSVRLDGPAMIVSAGDARLFEAKDPKPESGRVGVAGMGPGEVSFDELLIEPAAPSK